LAEKAAEPGRIRSEQVRIGHRGLMRVDFLLNFFHAGGQGFQRVLVPVGHLVRRGRFRLRRLGVFRRLVFLRFAAGFPRSQVAAALGHHIAVAAGIFDPLAVAFRRDDGGDDPVEKVAVMADEDDGAGVIGKQFLQKIERFDIEIVGRLVEHQQVGRLGKRAGEHDAAPFAAGKDVDRRARLIRREQEVLHVTDDMTLFAADRHAITAAAGERIDQRRGRSQRSALLIQTGNFKARAKRHGASIRRQRAGQEINQRRLTGTVRTDNADAVIPQNADREVFDDRGCTERLGNSFRLDNPLAGGFSIARCQIDRPGLAPCLVPRLTQIDECPKTAHVPLAPSRHAFV